MILEKPRKTFGKIFVTAMLVAMAAASGTPRGTVPRASAEKYAAHAEQSGAAIGVTLLSAKAAKKAFSTELDRCCMAVEVALYPQKDGMIEVSLSEFALREVGQDIASHPSSAELVAGKLNREARAESSGRDVTISPVAGVGYERNGIDPVTGARRSGVTTSAGVGVGIGGRAPQPGSSEGDRRTMTLELSEKGLPEGNTMQAVSGYLYFSMQQKKNAKYQLEYTLNGSKVVLPVAAQ